MNHDVKKCVSAFLLMVLLFSLMPAHAASAAAAEDGEYYGEAYLDLQSDEHRLAYRLIEEGIAGLSPRIEFQGIVEINYKQMTQIIRAVCVDHPQYFWFLEEGSFTYGDISKGGYIVSFDPTYILDGKEVSVGSQELADAMYAFHNRVREVIHSIPVNLTTDYEIALYLHDYLANRVTYTLEGEHPSAYAALIHGQAACYGYSKAYQCLLNAAGIRARTITGDSPDENGKLVGHAWNQVWLNDKCYYVDVTWDDFDEVILHAYFMIPLEKISEDHFADREFVLPECGHSAVDPYGVSQGMACASYITTAEQVAPYFIRSDMADGTVTFACEIRYEGNNFLDWLDWVSFDLLKQLDLTNFTKIYYYATKDTFYLQLVDTHYKAKIPQISEISLPETEISLDGPGKQYQLRPNIRTEGVWTPALTYASSDPTVAEVDSWGMITAVGEGTAEITLSNADGTVRETCTVSVFAAAKHVHTLRLFTSKQPTCVQDGYESYYLCSGCGLRFADAAASQALLTTADFIFPATGHLQYSWQRMLDYHVEKCACGYEKPNTTGNHVDDDADEKCDVCEGPMPKSPVTKPKGEDKADGEEASARWLIPAIAVAAVVLAIVVVCIIRKRCRDTIKPFGG